MRLVRINMYIYIKKQYPLLGHPLRFIKIDYVVTENVTSSTENTRVIYPQRSAIKLEMNNKM